MRKLAGTWPEPWPLPCLWPYLQYYYHKSKRVKELQEKKLCRAEEVLQVEKEAYADYAAPSCVIEPASIQKRGGGGYAEIALNAISAHGGKISASSSDGKLFLVTAVFSMQAA